jgi:Kef-type K+ transport system membrane component KefB
MAKEKKDTDLPEELIWISHIIMGLFFIYVGYSVLIRKQLPPYISVIVVLLGSIAILFHAHLWYIDSQKQPK